MAVAATAARRRRCRACRLELDPQAEACGFCSTPAPTVPDDARLVAAAIDCDDDEAVRFARGVLLGVAIVLIPLLIRQALLSF